MALKRGIDKAVEAITRELVAMSRPVAGSMIAQVATISANHNDAIGGIIAEAMAKVGQDGVITVEEGRRWRRRWRSSMACSSIAATSRLLRD